RMEASMTSTKAPSAVPSRNSMARTTANHAATPDILHPSTSNMLLRPDAMSPCGRMHRRAASIDTTMPSLFATVARPGGAWESEPGLIHHEAPEVIALAVDAMREKGLHAPGVEPHQPQRLLAQCIG